MRASVFTGPENEIGKSLHSKEPLAALTSQDDRVWSKIVWWVFNELAQAEELGIMKATASSVASTDVFGEQFCLMFQNAVGANGNFGEIYNKNLEDVLPRGNGMNRINKNSGMIYSFPFGNTQTQGPEPSVGGTIDAIRKRGALICGVSLSPGFVNVDSEIGTFTGMEVDICRGIAAALFNGKVEVQFSLLETHDRFSLLSAGAIDIVVSRVTTNIQREIREATTGRGFDFSPPYFYDAMKFTGILPYGLCADELTFDGTEVSTDCVNTKICVPNGSSWLDAMLGQLNIPENHLVMVNSRSEIEEKLISGECNVYAHEMTSRNVHPIESDEEYYYGKKKHTKEPFAVASRTDNIKFSDFVKWIVHGFFHAEDKGITMADVYLMPETKYFGDSLSRMWKDSVGVVENYGEIYKRNIARCHNRSGLNNLHLKDDPLLFAIPGA